MPEISLRAYGREIDELVERERLEEAIAHCRYILQTYSKHLETYRLLGKAYLEAKRYGDAADIFQRVLSAVPDDFVSHVGMAIVREDEGNLDAAIWHMERAFETNPSNPAIQQEMKRLISRRDGLEPHKVRLTRGALARMYAHGELFAQAIAELRSALQEDSERPDLQVLLANMYWQTDQRSDATAISNQILEKLPYCAEANRILAASLQSRDRIEEAAVYHRRLASLDPYAAFVESALIDSNSIEDSAVLLEKLDWVAGEPMPTAAPGQPGWAATLGMEMQEPAEDEPEKAKPAQTGPLPSWLEPGEPPPFEAAAEKELREEMELRATGESEEEIDVDILDQIEGDEIEMAGAEDVEQPHLEEVGEPEDDEDEGPGAIGVTAAAAGVAAGFIASRDDEELEEEFESEAAEAEDAALGEAAKIGAAAEMFDQSVDEAVEDIDIPLEEVVDEAEDLVLADEVSEPSLEPETAADQAPSEEAESAAESEIPEWMQEAGWTESSGEAEETPVSFSDQELDALDAGQLVEDTTEEGDEELTPAELPDWIHDIAPEDADGSSDGVGEESLPGWIGTEAPTEGEELIEDAIDMSSELEPADDVEGEGSFPTAESDTSELPTWITEEAPGATETIVTWLEDKGPDTDEEELAEGDELPDWMRDTGPLEDTLEPEQIVEEVEATGLDEPKLEEPIGDPEEEPSPATPAEESWLSAVAAAAADEESDASSAEAEVPETPEWLTEAMEEPDESGFEQGLGIAAAAAVGMLAGDEDELDDAVSEAEAEDLEAEALDELPSAQITDEEGPSVEAETGVPATAAPMFAAEAEISEEEAPSFAVEDQDFSSVAADAELAESDSDQAAVSSAPDWLEEIGSGPQGPIEPDTAEWLDGLEIDGEEAPAQPESETPDWLKGLADEGADAEASGTAPAPDWLREIGEPGSVAREAEASDAASEAGIGEQPVTEEVGGAPDWLGGIGDEIDESSELEQAAEAVEPEPDQPPEPEVEPPVAIEEDDEVMDWLEDLAAKQAEAPDEDELEAAAQVAAAAAPVLEERDIPDEPEEGLEWLEQLADQRGMDVDVDLPSQAPTAPLEAEPEPAAEPESGLDTTPGWLDRMATQPIPQADLEALDAATRGEEISPDAETIKAQGSDVKAHLEETAAELEPEEGPEEVAPDDVTIEARAGDLLAEMEAAEQEAEPVEEEDQFEEEIPAWLITAAGQAEELEPEEAAVEPDDQVAVEALEPELSDEPSLDTGVSEVEPDIEQALGEQEIQPQVPEPDIFEPEEPEQILDIPEVEQAESPEPALAQPEPEAPPPEAEPEAIRKKEDLLELSRQALASGDAQSAAEMYGDLIKRKESLESVIEDLRLAVDRTPDNSDLWQALGDAYMRDDQTDEAIDAYRKGMEAA